MDLFSKNYINLQKELHARPEGYGGSGWKWFGEIMYFAGQVGAESILDYGAGERTLKEEWKRSKRIEQFFGCVREFDEYDPAVPGIDDLPDPAIYWDLVVCTDVLEHVEPDRLNLVLSHIFSTARRGVFFVVATRESNKVMSNGHNAHLIIKPVEWWEEAIGKFWKYAPSHKVTHVLNESEFVVKCIK